MCFFIFAAAFQDDFPQLLVQAYRKLKEAENSPRESLGQFSFSLADQLLSFEQLLGARTAGAPNAGHSVRAVFHSPKGDITVPTYNGSAWITVRLEDADDIPADAQSVDNLSDASEAEEESPEHSIVSSEGESPPLPRIETPVEVPEKQPSPVENKVRNVFEQLGFLIAQDTTHTVEYSLCWEFSALIWSGLHFVWKQQKDRTMVLCFESLQSINSIIFFSVTSHVHLLRLLLPL